MKAHVLVGSVLLLAVTGCQQMPGTPKTGVEVPNPDSVTNFAALYGENCAGCHGDNGRNGASFNLSNPDYQAWVDDATLREIIANGESDTQMPAFAQSAGGFLTDAQVDALVHGMRSSWKTSAVSSAIAPPYISELQGNAARGQQVYQTACARCHRQPSQSIANPTFLALVNDQTLRTIIVAGRPDIGQPNWQQYVPGHALTDQEVTDVVAWLTSQRTQTPGQPYSQPQQ
jgi:cytochrome c oxidase cbb3-type subunit 3